MPYQVVWAKCNVFALDGTSMTLDRGSYLPGELDEVQVSQLATVGAVQFVDSSLPVQQAFVATASAPIDYGKGDPPEPDVPVQLSVVQSTATLAPESSSALAFDPPSQDEGMASVPVPEESPTSPDGDVRPGEVVGEPPPTSAPKAAWVEFAQRQGLTEEEANELSKAELVSRFG